jgi:hypothetical protein
MQMEFLKILKEITMEENKKQNYRINNFIGIFDNYMPDMIIDNIVKWFKIEEERKNIYNRLQAENCSNVFKKDETVFLDFIENAGWMQKIPGLVENFFQVIKIYTKEIPIQHYLNYKDLDFNQMRVQKTLPGGGYHVWHIEASDTVEMLKRVLTFTIYLNEVEEGGETEFLYQSVRVKPVKGRIVIWPASFPFVHRGNPPLSNEKYILTSWLSGRYEII